jgi:sulfur transfer complex TusBCD TusB component (DsrH family)
MAQALAEGVKPIDYAGFVELAAQHKNCQSWL